MRPCPSASIAPRLPQPPGMTTDLGSTPRSTSTWQLKPLRTCAPSTPNVRARARRAASQSWLAVLNDVYKRPSASRHRPWPMKMGTPKADASSSSSASMTSLATFKSLVKHTSTMQSSRILESFTALHTCQALNFPGQFFKTSVSCWGFCFFGWRGSARSNKDLVSGLLRKRFSSSSTGPNSVPRGLFQEGATASKSSSGIPLKLPQ
mmetsp:Transcript_81189/g.188600  ORF Transcript_81189/g.188600 Transcript_81189/m.188600 type:complete len:207 (-) Transcript_81189:381-1001(-)